MDWKEQLAALKTAQCTETPQAAPVTETVRVQPTKPKQTLCLRYEKRNGKPVTIISEIEGTEAALKELAKRLKAALGVGGSARDDEILLQGDVRQKVSSLLQAEGYRLKGDIRKA